MASKGTLLQLACCILATIAMETPLTTPIMITTMSSNNTDAQKVNVTLYYESLCPYCRRFIQTSLAKAVKDIGDIMDLTLLPYGNAREVKMGTQYVVTCQHGQYECLMNLLHACAIHYQPNTNDHFPFILCLETQRTYNWITGLNQCASKVGTSNSTLSSCVRGTLGNKLMHEVAKQTGIHTYVPYLIVNGKNLNNPYTITKAVCKAYKGPKPAACSK